MKLLILLSFLFFVGCATIPERDVVIPVPDLGCSVIIPKGMLDKKNYKKYWIWKEDFDAIKEKLRKGQSVRR